MWLCLRISFSSAWSWPLAAGVDRLPFALHTLPPAALTLTIVGVNSELRAAAAAAAVLGLIEFAYGLLCSIRLTASHSLTKLGSIVT